MIWICKGKKKTKILTLFHPQVLSEEDKEYLGITQALIEFVENVSQHPSTFINFPLDDDDEVELILEQKKRRDSFQRDDLPPGIHHPTSPL